MSLILINNLVKTYADNSVLTPVLKGVQLSVGAGETVAIVGSSGAGKSTLLHIIGTLDQPSQGEVLFEGQNLFLMSEAERSTFRNITLGFVFQFHHLLPDFSAEENVMMPLLLRHMPFGKSRIKAREIMEQAALGNCLARRPAELSGGEQQRVALCRALVGFPRLVLADEPTGNLDVETGRKVFDLLLALNKELKATLIVVTHNEDLVSRLEKRYRLVDGIVKSEK